MHAYLGTGEEILADKGSTCSTDQELLRLAADRVRLAADMAMTPLIYHDSNRLMHCQESNQQQSY